MKVTVMNPEALKDLYENHGKFACVCYATDESKAKGVGKHCQDNGHMSGSRCEYIKFKITEVDRGTAEQALRHEIGTHVPYDMMDNYNFTDWMDRVTNVNPDGIVKNMASFRYIDKHGFRYATPPLIAAYDDVMREYEDFMAIAANTRERIIDKLTKHGIAYKDANEDANFILPRATTTEFVIGFSPEAFIHFCHKRLCVRAQYFIRQMTTLMVEAIREYNPRFAEECVPQCEHLLWCPEGKQSCGRYFTREELKNRLED